MYKESAVRSNVIQLQTNKNTKRKKRKIGINRNKDGSVRNINGKVYVDFMYLGERVRESSGLKWNDENEKTVRKQLDKIMVYIESGEFRFSDTFPKSEKKELFTGLEKKVYKRNKTPDQVLFKDYVWEWFDLRVKSGNIEGRTLYGYKGYINKYLYPYYGDMPFSFFNKSVFDEFVGWAKDQKYRGKSVKNESIKKYFVPLKIICNDASMKYGWGITYNPFFGFQMPKETKEEYEKIFPFSIEEQKIIIDALPEHWKPYFRFAFSSGISQGEQITLRTKYIRLNENEVEIAHAITKDLEGKTVEGTCKNKYRKRTILLSPKMLSALKDQESIYEQFKGKYFFCTETGNMVDPSNLRKNVWIPIFKKIDVEYRDMRQTRHSFATYQLSKGKNPLQIAHVMGHKDAEMVIKVYSKYLEKGASIGD